MKALRNAALDYAHDFGWHVLPLRPGSKVPLTRNGKNDATDNLGAILRWWTANPRANIGVNCHESGFIAIDVDPRNSGDDSLHELEGELGPLPETVSAETAGGGWHYLFRHPGVDLVGVLADGVDVKDHGYIVAAPSVVGRPYAWDIGPDEMEPAMLPAEWLERLTSPRAVRREDLALNLNHDDPLRRIPASVYAPKLARRSITPNGWMQCPFHGGGSEGEPSLLCEDSVWACYGCRPPAGKRVQGGNVYEFAALIADYPVPLRGPDFLEVRARLDRFFRVER